MKGGGVADRYDTFEMFTPGDGVAAEVVEAVAGPTRLFLEIETGGGVTVFAETDPVSGYTLGCGVLGLPARGGAQQ